MQTASPSVPGSALMLIAKVRETSGRIARPNRAASRTRAGVSGPRTGGTVVPCGSGGVVRSGMMGKLFAAVACQIPPKARSICRRIEASISSGIGKASAKAASAPLGGTGRPACMR